MAMRLEELKASWLLIPGKYTMCPWWDQLCLLKSSTGLLKLLANPFHITETKDALVRASDLPLSVLIVGVGDADFKQMEILDADNGNRLESSTGRMVTRDIVLFIPMREVYGGQILVVQALLEELPHQFLSYVRARDIKPHSYAASRASA